MSSHRHVVTSMRSRAEMGHRGCNGVPVPLKAHKLIRLDCAEMPIKCRSSGSAQGSELWDTPRLDFAFATCVSRFHFPFGTMGNFFQIVDCCLRAQCVQCSLNANNWRPEISSDMQTQPMEILCCTCHFSGALSMCTLQELSKTSAHGAHQSWQAEVHMNPPLE